MSALDAVLEQLRADEAGEPRPTVVSYEVTAARIPMVPRDEKAAVKWLKGHGRPAPPQFPIRTTADLAHAIHRLQQAGWDVRAVERHARQMSNQPEPDVRLLVQATHGIGHPACFARVPFPAIAKA